MNGLSLLAIAVLVIATTVYALKKLTGRTTEVSDTIKLHYESSANISFHGTLDTGIPAEDWAEYSDNDRDDVIQQALNELVDVSVVEQ